MADNIGRWARRVRFTGGVSRANRPLTAPVSRAHLVESEIADRLVMRCGREMRTSRERPFEFEDSQPADGCYWCIGAKTVVVE